MKTLITFLASFVFVFTSSAQSYHGKFRFDAAANANGNAVTNIQLIYRGVNQSESYLIFNQTPFNTTTLYGIGGVKLLSDNGNVILGVDGVLTASSNLVVDGIFSGNLLNGTNLPVSGIQSPAGVGILINANQEIVRTNNVRDITIIQKPSGAILYSNGVNAGVISGASSIQLLCGFPNNTFVFSTNADVVVSGFNNWTNGWQAQFSYEFTNSDSSAHTYTFQGFHTLMTNGVKVTSAIVTIPAGEELNIGGDIRTGETNAWGVVQ